LKYLIALTLALSLGLSSAPLAKGISGHSGKSGAHQAKSAKSNSKAEKKGKAEKKQKADVARDEKGRIQRSDAARHAFARQTGYPHGRPGYVIDHIKPLACGGIDAPSNMQWQTKEAARLKDKTERVGC
jgi:hypothetical protein